MKNFPEHLNHIQEKMGLLGKFIPETMGAFSKLHKASAGDGALDSKTKELIALAIGIVVRCDGCVLRYVIS